MNSGLHTLPGWARGVIYTCGGTAAAAIQLGSSWSLGSLAIHAGLGMPRALLLPVALDLGAIVAACLWVAGDGRQRITGRWSTIGLVLSSISFNAADSLVTHGKLHADQLLYIAVGIAMIFPLTAALMGHIVLLVRESDSAAAAERARVETERREAERKRTEELVTKAAAVAEKTKPARTEKVPVGNPLLATLPGSNKGEKLEAYIRQCWDRGVEKSAAQFERELYGTDTGYARRATAALRTQGVKPPSERPPVAVNGHKLTLAN